MRACVCACVRACVRACVHARSWRKSSLAICFEPNRCFEMDDGIKAGKISTFLIVLIFYELIVIKV